jgi:predicted RNA binding protein YcfA (HicA-like mRNA interferase family)
MSQTAKLIARIRRRPPQAEFSDVRHHLIAFGWTEDRQRGSHVIFVKAGALPIVVPLVQGSKVKRAYLDQLIEILRLDEWEETQP